MWLETFQKIAFYVTYLHRFTFHSGSDLFATGYQQIFPSQVFMTKLYRVGKQSAWHDWGFRVSETWDFRCRRERLINKKVSETVVAMKLLLWEKRLPGFLLLLLMLFSWWHFIKKCTSCAGKGSDAFAFSAGPFFLSAAYPGLDWLDGK